MPIRILGPVVLTDRTGHVVPIAGHKARALLALLAIRPNRVVPVEQLEDELWHGTPSTGARTTLHAHISRLRAALREADASATLVTSGCGYQLTIPSDDLDSSPLRDARRAGAEAAPTSPEAAVSQLARSLEEWRGAALQGLHDYEPLFLEAQRLEELRLVAVEERWAAELELGGHLLAIGQLQRLVVDHPYRERLAGPVAPRAVPCGTPDRGPPRLPGRGERARRGGSLARAGTAPARAANRGPGTCPGSHWLTRSGRVARTGDGRARVA